MQWGSLFPDTSHISSCPYYFPGRNRLFLSFLVLCRKVFESAKLLNLLRTSFTSPCNTCFICSLLNHQAMNPCYDDRDEVPCLPFRYNWMHVKHPVFQSGCVLMYFLLLYPIIILPKTRPENEMI